MYQGLQNDIEHLLQSLFLSTPDMFVVPKLYHQYRNLFDFILGDVSRYKASKSLPDVCRVMRVYWSMIKARNEVFCGTIEENEMRIDNEPIKEKLTQEDSDPSNALTASSEVYEERVVHVLDSIGKNADSITGLLINGDTWLDVKGHTARSATKSIFGSTQIPPQTFINIIHIMCRWATSESRYGDWKAYLVGSILMTWREQDKSEENKSMLQDALIRFLDGKLPAKTIDTLVDSEEGTCWIYIVSLINVILTFFLDTRATHRKIQLTHYLFI